MLTFTEDYHDQFPYPIESFGSHSGYLFFDIETTGLSAKSSHLYLIGCLYTNGREFHLTQWFAEHSGEEREVLCAFSDYLNSLPSDCLLLQFNGNGFDVPYLRQRYEKHQLPFLLDKFESLDLYRLIKPYKNLLGLPSLRQKAVEEYLEISRTDVWDGGQLISVYEDYTETGSQAGLEALLLHNLEDVKNMPKLLAILSIQDYIHTSYLLENLESHTSTALDGSKKQELLVTLRSPVSLPHPISLRLDCGTYLTASLTRIRLAVPLRELTLKHYFPNAKDYFYLPEEDRAIHKSVGIYVDPEYRQKATKDTCYNKKQGIFIPCPASLTLSQDSFVVFHQNPKEKDYYLEWPFPENPSFWDAYVHAIWRCR
jgi:hypothetical protein